MRNPKVSICIPTYNYGYFLPDAVDSVLAQSFTDFDLIVVDNCSTDNSGEIVARYQKVDARVKYYRNDTNIGLVGNLNRCLQLASGEYIKILCADDVLEPTCLEKSVRALDEHPSLALVSSARYLVDRELKPIEVASYWDKPIIVAGKSLIRECFYHGNLIGEPSAVLFRRRDCRRGFIEKYKQISDLEMWFNLLENGDCYFDSDRLVRIRQHEKQGTKTNIQEFVAIDDEILLCNEYIQKEYIGESVMSVIRWKSKLATIIWHHKLCGVNINPLLKKLREYYNPKSFHVYRYIYAVSITMTRILRLLNFGKAES